MALECTRSYYANRGNRKAFFVKRLHIQEKVSFPSQWMQHAFVSRFLVMIVRALRITGFNPHFDQQEWNDNNDNNNDINMYENQSGSRDDCCVIV